MSSSIFLRAKSLVTFKTALSSLTYENAKTVLFAYVLLSYTLQTHRHLRAHGLRHSIHDAWIWLQKQVIFLALRTPAGKNKVDTEMAKAREGIVNRMVPKGPNVIRHLALPSEGRSIEWIEQEMNNMDSESSGANWRLGKLSGAVYHGGEDMEKVINMAFQKYTVSNPLHPDVFPAIRKMDAEVVAMCLRMYNNPDGAGTTTSGGTESIIMAVKTHRDWAREVKGIRNPEIIIPSSAHAAFDKAGAYLKIKVHHIPVDPITREVPVGRVARAINGNTIMLVGSAVNFPDGCMDDIVALGKLSERYKIGLHVDCCLGSFIVPFLEEAGFPVKRFDFRVPGVTSISCDTHKYGFAPKGSSVIMYRSAELRRHQYFVSPDWPGGVYASPSLAGSRPGALIAGTWAAMQFMGHEGYVASCRSIVACTKKIETAIANEIPELYVLGKPPASVVAFGSNNPVSLNALEVGDAMGKRGWHLNGLSDPPAVHIACTRLTVPIVDQFIADLKECVQEAKTKPSGSGHMVTVYGLGNSSAVGPAFVSQAASIFLDTLYAA
ncbi:PLP-dependent transferase [Ramaria rubella]|nr:PLP-dependent transferase [Ramaria rubella]